MMICKSVLLTILSGVAAVYVSVTQALPGNLMAR